MTTSSEEKREYRRGVEENPYRAPSIDDAPPPSLWRGTASLILVAIGLYPGACLIPELG